MKKQWIDIFHQVECVDSGYVAITDYTGDIPTTRCFTPDGECFGGTRTSNELTRAANIRIIIKQRKSYDRINNQRQCVH